MRSNRHQRIKLFNAARIGNGAVCIWLYAGKPEYPALPRIVRPGVYHGDNVTGADNQQERLSRTESAKWFLAGFVEGEGSLCVSIKKHPTSRFGFIASPEFFLYQHESGRRILELAQRTFETGGVHPKTGNPKVLVYRVSDRRKLRTVIVPFFERYVMPFSCKRAMFEEFREILEMMARKEHFTPFGLIAIVEKAYEMNPHGKGRERFRSLAEVRERILRGHTSDLQLALG